MQTLLIFALRFSFENSNFELDSDLLEISRLGLNLRGRDWHAVNGSE